MKEPYFKLLASIGATSHWIMGARTDRTLHYGSNVYAMEELVAELGAAFLCATLGISTYPRPGHAACSASWLQVLNGLKAKALIAARGACATAGLAPLRVVGSPCSRHAPTPPAGLSARSAHTGFRPVERARTLEDR